MIRRLAVLQRSAAHPSDQEAGLQSPNAEARTADYAIGKGGGGSQPADTCDEETLEDSNNHSQMTKPPCMMPQFNLSAAIPCATDGVVGFVVRISIQCET